MLAAHQLFFKQALPRSIGGMHEQMRSVTSIHTLPRCLEICSGQWSPHNRGAGRAGAIICVVRVQTEGEVEGKELFFLFFNLNDLFFPYAVTLLFKFFKNVDHFEVFVALVALLQDCFHFMFWFFGLKTHGILHLQPAIKPAPLALEAWSLNHRTARKVAVTLLGNETSSSFFCWTPAWF